MWFEVKSHVIWDKSHVISGKSLMIYINKKNVKQNTSFTQKALKQYMSNTFETIWIFNIEWVAEFLAHLTIYQSISFAIYKPQYMNNLYNQHFQEYMFFTSKPKHAT